MFSFKMVEEQVSEIEVVHWHFSVEGNSILGVFFCEHLQAMLQDN